MMPTVRFQVVHSTTYGYSQPMADGFTTLHLQPRSTPHQTVELSEISIDPTPDEYDASLDTFGNHTVQFAVHRPHTELTIASTIVVAVQQPEPVPNDDLPWEHVRELARTTGVHTPLVGPYLANTSHTPALESLRSLGNAAFPAGLGVVAGISALCQKIFTDFQYDAGFSDVTTPLETVMSAQRGVCQDFSHIAAATLRSLGIPARYVSGYIETNPPDGQPRVVGADASHAWCSAWAGPHGWLDFDPTNNQMPPTQHVTVGWGRDYRDVTPVRGVVIGPRGPQTLSVSVDVVRLAE